MSTIHRLNDPAQLAERIFPQESELYFKVGTRPAGWMTAEGKFHRSMTEHKVIVRDDNGKPVDLAVVGAGYKLVHNRPLFGHAEQVMAETITPKHLHGVEVIDRMAYNGRDCYREYRFPNMKLDMQTARHPVSTDGGIAFRIIIGNGYGGQSIKLLAGAIDFFCTNGIVSGSVERNTRRHTSGVEIPALGKWIAGMIDMFWTNGDMWRQWQGQSISATMLEMIMAEMVANNQLSEQRAKWLKDRFVHECDDRGNQSLWEVYSALTQWATHSKIRETGNDHSAVTRITRETEASKLMTNVVKLYQEAA